jgi:DNA-binding transcriptional MerR regulator
LADVTSIGAVAAELGLSVEALRYYERAGLSAPTRDSGGRRVYSAFDLDQLRLVTALRAVGIPVAAIRQLLAAKEPGADVRSRAERASRQLTEMDGVLRARESELRAARRLVRAWRAEIDQWLAVQPQPGQPAR